MKKTFFKIAAATLLIVGLAFNFAITNTNNSNGLASLKVITSSAIAQSEVCPNGCHDNGDGCYCHVWWEDYKEHVW